MRGKRDYQDLQTHLEEGRRDYCIENSEMKETSERRNEGVNWEDDSRLDMEERPSNTPSQRDSIEFEYKDVLKE